MRRSFTARLLADQRSGLSCTAGIARAGKRLHRNRRGNVSVLFVFLGIGLFCAASMVWNTGETVAARVELQTAADTAAYASAMWNTRAVNNITGTNMLILRNASALAASVDTIVTTIAIPVNWDRWARGVAAGCGPFFPECYAAAMGFVILKEGSQYLTFATTALPEAIEGLFEFPDRLEELFRYEQSWVQATPRLIEEQRAAIEKYYDCSIRVTEPGLEGRVEPPLERGDFLTIMLPLMLRFFMVDDGWPSDSQFRTITIGKGPTSWNLGGLLGVLVAAAVVNDDHYILPTRWAGFLEKGPETPQEWRDFTVVAAARREGALRGRYVAPGVFDDPPVPGDAMLAFAQAETYNGIDGRLSQFALGGVETLVRWYPFRVWTTWGWQWQTRLGVSDQLEAALEGDPELRRWFADLEIHQGSTNGWEALNDIVLH